MLKIAFLFPGQGAQSVGMGRDLYESSSVAREVLDQFTRWTHPDLQTVMFDGPEETLKRTLYTQPAILSVSLAALAAFCNQTALRPDVAAGHSLGEYGALYAAGVIDLETAARLIKRRAEAMEAAPAGAMAAILGLAAEKVEAVVRQSQAAGHGVVAVANYNTPEQIVISGDPAAVEAACTLAKEQGAMKTVMLPVGGAFHSPLMEPAGQSFGEYLQAFSFRDADFPVLTNVDAQPTRDAEQFRQKLARQIAASVRWDQTIRHMLDDGVETFIEFGPGRVLTGMMKRIARQAKLYNVSDAASLAQTVAAVSSSERILTP